MTRVRQRERISSDRRLVVGLERERSLVLLLGGRDLPLVLEMRDLKLSMTTLCADVVLRALSVTGLSGYKRGSKFSVERNVRDVLGGQLMANNNRFYVDNAQLLLMIKQA